MHDIVEIADKKQATHLWKLFVLPTDFPLMKMSATVSTPSRRMSTLLCWTASAVILNVFSKVHVSRLTHLYLTSLNLQEQSEVFFF
jgi:hypothetical protein